MTVEEYVAANVAKAPQFTQAQRDRLYGLLAPARVRLTAVARSRLDVPDRRSA